MSLYVLDTAMLTLYRRGHEAIMRHALTHPPEDLASTVITVKEQLSGWYTRLRQVKASADLTRVYDTATFSQGACRATGQPVYYA